MTFVIRPAVLADSAVLTRMRLDFVQASHPECPMGDELAQATRAFFDARLVAPGVLSFWVAEANGQVVAHAVMTLFQRLPNLGNVTGREGYISNLVTLPGYRRRGIAAALMAAMTAEARELGMGRLWLYASAEGEPLYAGLGYSQAVSDVPMMELNLAEQPEAARRSLCATLEASIAAGGYVDDLALNAAFADEALKLRLRGVGE
jgi:GNAT superfamily N-acetyltransferase